MAVKSFLRAFRYVVLGAAVFWIPSVFLHWLRGNRFSGLDAVTLTILLPVTTCLALAFYWKILREPQSRLTFALFAVLGIWLLGPMMMSVGASITGVGFSQPGGLQFVLIGTCLFPAFTFIMSTYDGTLGALLLTSVLLPLLPAVYGRAKQA